MQKVGTCSVVVQTCTQPKHAHCGLHDVSLIVVGCHVCIGDNTATPEQCAEQQCVTKLNKVSPLFLLLLEVRQVKLVDLGSHDKIIFCESTCSASKRMSYLMLLQHSQAM